MTLQLAEQFEDNEQYNEAYAEYKKLYAQNPKDLSLLERLGHIAMLLNINDEASNYYSKILESDATNTMAYEQLMDIYIHTDRYKYYVYRGNLHQVEQKYEHAINDYKKAINATTEEDQINSARFVLATLLEQTGQISKAIDEYLKVLDHQEADEAVYLKLANLYVKEDMLSSAVDVLERARAHGVETPKIKETLAQLYLKTGNSTSAIELTGDEVTKIKCLLGDGKMSEAWSAIEAAEKNYKKDPKFLAVKAQYFYETNENEKALETVTEYDKFEKNSPISYQMRALIYENLKDEYNAHLNWGRYNLVRGQKDIAINEFLNAFGINNESADLAAVLASLHEETGDKHHAMEFYEKLVELEPENKTALEKLAKYRESIGDYRAQADYLEKLLEADKRNYTVMKDLGLAYEKLRNKPDALAMYSKYLQVASGDSDYDKIKAKFDKLNNTEMAEEEGLIDKIMKMFNRD